MTVKEIAKFCGKDERTVQRWIKKVNDKMSVHNDKFTLQKGHETDFDIDEVEQILLSSSLSKYAVSILMENARNKNQVTTEYVTKNDLQLFAKEIVTETMKQVIPVITSQTMQLVSKLNTNSQLQIEQDYYSIKGYANKISEKITFSEAKALGKKAVEISKEKKLDIVKVDDERFGYVNSYHIDVLKEVFAL